MFSCRGDRLQDILHDKSECGEAANHQKICDGPLDTLTLVSLQCLPSCLLDISVYCDQSVGPNQLLSFVLLNDLATFFGKIWKQFAKCFVLQVELEAPCSEQPLVCLTRLDGPESGTLFKHE